MTPSCKSRITIKLHCSTESFNADNINRQAIIKCIAHIDNGYSVTTPVFNSVTPTLAKLNVWVNRIQNQPPTKNKTKKNTNYTCVLVKPKSTGFFLLNWWGAKPD